MSREIHLFESSPDPLLFSEHILEEKFAVLLTNQGDIFKNQDFLSSSNHVSIGFAHLQLLISMNVLLHINKVGMEKLFPLMGCGPFSKPGSPQSPNQNDREGKNSFSIPLLSKEGLGETMFRRGCSKNGSTTV
jgi:hypothetical protein